MKKWFVLWTVLCAGALVAEAQTPPSNVVVEKDLVYGQSDGVDLKLDLAIPANLSAPAPALVCIHGGGWQTGSKDGYAPYLSQFAAFGYVAAAVEYRMLPKYRWPSQIEDVKCAVRFLRAHANEFNIDPNKIGAIGDSAGGHLALLLGLMDPKDGLEGTGGAAGSSSKVQAVVNLFGPTDLHVWRALPEGEPAMLQEFGKTSDQLLADLVGTPDRAAPVVAQASPVTYIDKDDPPVLTFHGTKDPIVPFEQAKLLHDALEKAGVQQKLVVMQDAGHGWTGPQLINTVVQGVAFFDSILKGATPAPRGTSAAGGQ